jgi:hypothetical protein
MAYANPIGAGLRPERIDMGVDYGGSGPLYALGNGKIVNLYNSGWPGGTFLVLQLADGPYAGKYIYYAEDVAPLVQVGQSVTAGQHIANATGGSSGIEVGWADNPAGTAMAAATGQDKAGLSQKGDPGAFSTAFGVLMSDLIRSLGGPAGVVDNPVQGTIPSGWASVSGKPPPTSHPSGGTPAPSSSDTTDSGPSTSDLTGLLAPVRNLLHAVATVIDYAFTMFQPGQGPRFLFAALALIAGFLSYRVLATSGSSAYG